MFTAKLMKNTPIKIFIDNRFPILHKYPRTESNTPTYTGGGLIQSHFWLEILLL